MPQRRKFFLAAGAVGVPLVGLGLSYAYWRRSKVRQMAGDAPVPADRGFACPVEAGSVVLLGDSRVSRWQPQPAPAGLPVANRGIGGETLRSLTDRFHRDGIACRPRAIVLQAGINDLVSASFRDSGVAHAIADATVQRFVTLAGACRAAGVELVLMTVIPPGRAQLLYRVEGVATLAALTGRVNQALRGIAWPAGVRLLDAAALLGEGGKLHPRFQDDTLHLQPAAYQVLNTALMPLLMSTAAPAAGWSARP